MIVIRTAAALCISMPILACSPQSEVGPDDNEGTGSDGPGTTSGGAGSGTSGSTGDTGGAGSIGSSGSGATGGFETCASTEHKAEALPLDMHIMLDQSGSMAGNTWAAVVSAITGFVSSPETDGIGVGLAYFPITIAGDPCSACTTQACCQSCGANSISCINGACTCSSSGGQSCEVSDYEQPDVAIQPLPGVKDAIVQSLNAHNPNGGTPTRPALEGAMNHAKTWAAMPANADHRVIVVLATDGEPTGCTANGVPDVVAIAASGLPDILTFVIGVGTELVALNQVAAAGGTSQALMVDTGGNVEQQFIDAMKAIQDKADIQCEFQIPTPGQGEQLDFAKVNVVFTPEGQSAVTILYVENAANCDPQTGGWYYDNPNAPTKIVVCEATCDALEQDSAPEVDILLGCQTETIPK